jgi:EAL domain-containing protein (putative c-di-GMP-specific phosphodiesterase class I)
MVMGSEITLQEIEDALANDEFVYYYQPKVSMHTGRICGAEALIRWFRSDGSMVSPAEFIPLAESSGFIKQITLAMFQKLVVDINIINDLSSGDDQLVLSFNASAKDFHDHRLIDAIANAIRHKQLEAKQLEVELTETVLLNDNNEVRRHLQDLEEMGVALSMDDYGIGFSSIDTLARWHFSTIKLDQGIVGKLDDSTKSFTIAQSSIHMAHQLELDVVAEGIESESAYRTLQNLGCSVAQGYWISRPVPLADLLEFNREGKCWPVVPIGLLHLAQLDHIQWRKSIIDGVFYRGLRKDTQEIRGAPESDPTSCRLGRWFYQHGQHYAGGSSWAVDFERHHNRLHEIGIELLESAKHREAKHTQTALMRQLTEQSIIVIGLLQELENILIAEQSESASSSEDLGPAGRKSRLEEE